MCNAFRTLKRKVIKVFVCYHHASYVFCVPTPWTLNGWTNLYEIWYEYRGILAHGNCVVRKSFPLCTGYSGRKSKLSTNNKLLIYKVILKPVWTYGIQLWGTTSNSNIKILERFWSKVLRLIVDAPWYVSNSFIRNDLQIPQVKKEISRFSSHYNVGISVHPNELDTGPTTCLSDSSNLY
jgi:hypothetical protein